MKLVATSVVRGSQQGESHGGVYLLDLEGQHAELKVDWNDAEIDWSGRGGDRGLRGIAFDGDIVYIVASDELFAFRPDFSLMGSWPNPYLKHCHETSVYQRTLYIASTGFDSIIGFDLDDKTFTWALHVDVQRFRFRGEVYDPRSEDGPLQLNKLHINNVHCNGDGMYLSGLRTGGMVHFNGRALAMSAELPAGTHNAQPFRNGVVFNDSEADRLRYAGRGDGREDRAMPVPKYALRDLQGSQFDDGHIARQGFARGLAVVSDSVVAGGSSPSTVGVYDLAGNHRLVSVNLSMDVRNAIHGLEVWPYD
ncbi:MAG: hypothetical protein OXT64_18300 [Gammaproteobacteria bacterium]|nr:hypothetical protein [Gammaproteobacteria bacterium]MDE0441359.1 hypothetical protein [Gammaproteobacteria bacterium]